jgi:hypothetical protein
MGVRAGAANSGYFGGPGLRPSLLRRRRTRRDQGHNAAGCHASLIRRRPEGWIENFLAALREFYRAI